MENILDCKKYLETHIPSIYSSTNEITKRRQLMLEIMSRFDRSMIVDIASSSVKARLSDCDFFNRKWALLQREVMSYEKLSLHFPTTMLNSFVEAVRFEAYKDKVTKKDDKKAMVLNEICVSRDAMVGKYNGVYTSFRMPKKSGYFGYVYCVYNRNIRDSYIYANNVEEEAYILKFKQSDVIKLFVKDKVEELSVRQLYAEVNNVCRSEYPESNEKVTFSIKDRNIVEYRPQSIQFKLTNFEGELNEMSGFYFFLPNAFTKREPCGNKILVKTPEGFKVSVYRESDHKKCDIPIQTLKDYMVSNYYNPSSSNTKEYASKIIQSFSKEENENDK